MIDNSIIALLTKRQLGVFVWIYQEILNAKVLTKSNEEISRATGVPVSTLEKFLKRFEDLQLIVRKSDRSVNASTYQWETISREITLDPRTFDPGLLAQLRTTGIKAILDQISQTDLTSAAVKELQAKRATAPG
ncbi:MAG: hypothetical protein WC509_02110 [Candidatus Izemoplasmatales bacterium]